MDMVTEKSVGADIDVAMAEKKSTTMVKGEAEEEEEEEGKEKDGQGEDGEPVSMASVRILDLRLLGQDEIRNIARLCGDVPARLRDLVRDLIINKSIFNESLGSRRQTFDRERERERERVTRKRDHHHRHLHHQNENENENKYQKQNQHNRPSSSGEAIVSSLKEGVVSSTGAAFANSKGDFASSKEDFLCAEGNFASSNREISLSGRTSLDSFGVSSHRELILHLSQQLRITEKNLRNGNGSMYQKENHLSLEEGVRPIRIKSMARASSTYLNRVQVQDRDNHPHLLVSSCSSPLLPPSSTTSVSVNGKALTISATEILHRVSKKMKTKDEARRKATLIPVNSQAVDIVTTKSGLETDIEGTQLRQEESKLEFQSVKQVSSAMEEQMPKERTTRSGSVIGINTAAAQCASDPRSPETPISQSESFMECSEPLMDKLLGKGSLFCLTCNKTFSNAFSLRRHAGSTGHKVDLSVAKAGISTAIKKQQSGRCLCVTCGNFYATPFTLKRHALAYGHSTEASMPPVEQEHGEIKDEGEADASDKNFSLPKPKLESLWPRHSWKKKVREFKCGKYQRRFTKKQQYVNHLDLHFKKSRKKMTRSVGKLLGRAVGSSKNQVKGKPISIPSEHPMEDVNEQEQDNDTSKRKHESEILGRQVRPHIEEMNVGKSIAMTCQECGKVFSEYSRYTGHLSMHSRFRKLYTAETSKANSNSSLDEASFDIDTNDLIKDLRESSALGFRKLISDTAGTYLSGLPAKLLFTGA